MRILLFLSMLGLFAACSSTDDSDTASSRNLSVTVNFVNHNSAMIRWTDSQDGGLYNILLNGNEVATNLASREYEITGLESETAYSGIVKTLGNGPQISVNFNFTTTARELKTYNDDIILASQQDVDVFGSEGYQKINGTLTIRGSNAPITSLLPLQSLVEVEEHLWMANLDITDLRGLENLEVVKQNLGIGGCPKLQDINKLESLTRVEGYISLANMPISDLSLVNRLQGFDGQIFLYQLNEIEHLDILNDNPFIEGISIQDNPNLRSIGGFRNTSEVGYLNIYHNLVLETVELEGLTKCTDGISLEENSMAGNISFPSLQETNSLYIQNNASLRNLDGFASVRSIPSALLIWNNDILENIKALSEVQHITEVSFINNPELQNLQGLSSLERATIFTIIANYNLQSLDGLENVTTVEGDFEIYDNPLQDFCAISTLVTSGGIQGELIIERNWYNPTVQDFIDGNCSL
jgi:hypothetical protein